jgi:hypothetical protein
MLYKFSNFGRCIWRSAFFAAPPTVFVCVRVCFMTSRHRMSAMSVKVRRLWDEFNGPQGLKGSARRLNAGNLPIPPTRPDKAHECAFEEKHPVRRVGDAVAAPEGAEIRTVVSCLLPVGSRSVS